LRKAAERLEQRRTPEGMPLLPNTVAELRRDRTRLRLINDQIAEIEAARVERLRQQPDAACHPMILPLARVVGAGIETAPPPARYRKAWCGAPQSPQQSDRQLVILRD
jgi:transposase